MKTNKPGSILSVLAVALLVSMALPASADHDDKTGKVHKDPEGKITYINAGLIGDHIIQCIGGISATLFPNGANSVQVIVHDPQDENAPPLVDETVPLPGGPYGPIPLVDIPDQRICLGGAASSTSDSTPPTIPLHWQVWIEDIVYKLIKDLTGGSVDIVPAGFARLVATAVRSTTTKDPATCVPPAPATPRICETTTVTEVQSKVLTQFSVCGKAGVTGIDTTAFTDLIAAKGAYDSYTLSKQVFVDGLLFFLFDCELGGTQVAGVYNEFVRWYNNDPSTPPGPPFSALPPNDASTCNSPLGSPPGGFLCLAPFPAGDSACWTNKYAAGHTAALPGIIGTVGWNHDDPSANGLNCLENLNESPWLKVIVVENGFVIQHFPVDVSINNP